MMLVKTFILFLKRETLCKFIIDIIKRNIYMCTLPLQLNITSPYKCWYGIRNHKLKMKLCRMNFKENEFYQARDHLLKTIIIM